MNVFCNIRYDLRCVTLTTGGHFTSILVDETGNSLFYDDMDRTRPDEPLLPVGSISDIPNWESCWISSTIYYLQNE